MPPNPDTMRAAVCTRYGPPETLVVTKQPVPQPGAGQLRIRVCAASVSAADHRIRAHDFPVGYGLIGRVVFGWSGPRQAILGGDLSGVVDAVGEGVDRFKPGDEVVALTGMGLGCHADYRCVKAAGAVCVKPIRLTHETAAAALFGGSAALDFLRRAKLAAGDALLVVGASGAVGSAAVQWAATMGVRVTAVCSARNADWVAGLGASRLIDYTRQSGPKPGETFDAVLDATGTVNWPRARVWLRPAGRFLALASGLPDALRAPWVAVSSRQRIVAGPAAERAEDLHTLMQAVADGRFTPRVDAVYPLARIRDAHRHVDTGRKRGSVIVVP